MQTCVPRCVALANGSQIASEKQRLMALASTWARLAEKIERTEAIVADSTKTQPSERSANPVERLNQFQHLYLLSNNKYRRKRT
jgi:hypothetical protein